MTKQEKSAYDKNYYLTNREKKIQRAKEYYVANKGICSKKKGTHRQVKRDFLRRYKLTAQCFDCGYADHPDALQFDHIAHNKHENVSHMTGYSWNRILTEVTKCVVRCANCHFIITHNRKQAQ